MSIRVLPDDLVNKIAAGEVVERPASVVKELVENAIDAGATNITIDVIDGGRTLVSVVDNGRGMNREDLGRAVMRHATSKLLSDDLLNISTMGFRGEALPSIASVSSMTIETNGLLLDVETGIIKPSAFTSGTRIRVKNLFMNVPARLKFMRSDRVEMMAVSDAVKRLALSRPDIGFYLNNKLKFKANEHLDERIAKVMGDDIDGKMLEVSAIDGDIKLSGFVSNPTLRRASGIDQYLFVNSRPVKDKVLVGALRAAYFDVMHAREFPLCCLYLELPAANVDVNVSPAKTDVHFLEPSRIRDFMVRTIRSVLARVESKVDGEMSMMEREGEHVMQTEHKSERSNFSQGISTSVISTVGTSPTAFLQPLSVLNNATGPLGIPRVQVANKYIISEIEDGIVIIDQHAAHERITYERLRGGKILRQQLLIPEIIKMNPGQAAAILEIKGELTESGLVVESFGDSEIAIYEKPADFNLDWAKCLSAVANEIMDGGHSSVVREKLHLKLANYACHHSVRAGQKLSIDQMNVLLREIERTERGGQCNHGRPVWKKISFAELDNMFERS